MVTSRAETYPASHSNPGSGKRGIKTPITPNRWQVAVPPKNKNRPTKNSQGCVRVRERGREGTMYNHFPCIPDPCCTVLDLD